MSERVNMGKLAGALIAAEPRAMSVDELIALCNESLGYAAIQRAPVFHAVFSQDELDALRTKCSGQLVTVQSCFAVMRPGASPSHADLCRAGRQLKQHFKKFVLSSVSHYRID